RASWRIEFHQVGVTEAGTHVLVSQAYVSLLEEPRGYATGAMRTGHEDVGSGVRTNVCQVDEELEPPDPIHVEVKVLRCRLAWLRVETGGPPQSENVGDGAGPQIGLCD